MAALAEAAAQHALAKELGPACELYQRAESLQLGERPDGAWKGDTGKPCAGFAALLFDFH